MDWSYYDLIILIKWWETPYKNLDKTLLFSTNWFFARIIENFDELQLP